MTLEAQLTEPAPRWELETLFSGGSASSDYADFVSEISADLDRAQASVRELPAVLDETTRSRWAAWVLGWQDLAERIHLAQAFTLSLISQDVNDAQGAALASEGVGLDSRWQILRAALEAFALKQDDAAWEEFLAVDGIADIRFPLSELRRNASLKMSQEKETLALELAVDGYHAWGLHYEKMAGDLRVDVGTDGRPRLISLGQNAPRFSDPDRTVRRDAFKKMEAAWESRADLAAMTLNAQAGFRLTLYRNRGWDSPLKEPLQKCRMEQATLDAMWSAVADAGGKLAEYVNARKRLLGIDRFCWYDQGAPAGQFDRGFSFGEAGAFIVEHLGSFSAEMGDFARRALADRWVEAEDRPGKRAGGWCSWYPLRKQARIFMTFAPNYAGLSTLAHEFGHAYHGFVLKDEPGLVQHYPMTLAETASIFNELRIADAALAMTGKRHEKLALLDQMLQSALVLFCNIRARYLFDCRFYAARKEGIVLREQLDAMMVDAQREAFFGMLDDEAGYHPLFWASKLHFFLTDVPFYNFPYTFGFLFARGVYDRANAEGASFAAPYRALLADTGRMTTEEVAQKHLGVDLRQRAFWDGVVGRTLEDVDAFVALCD